MGEIFGATGTNLEPWPPGNGTNFDVKPELLTFKFSPTSEAPSLSSIMATMISFACTAAYASMHESFGENHHRCVQHVKAPMGQCRAEGPVAKRVPIIVGIHDRNVGGSRAAAADPMAAAGDSGTYPSYPHASTHIFLLISCSLPTTGYEQG
jgi:hypothetical protein